MTRTQELIYDNIRIYDDFKKTYIKDYRRKEHSSKPRYGLSIKEVYELELECMRRVKGVPHMCQLVNYDRNSLILELEWAGNTLENIYKNKLDGISKEDFIMQFEKAFKILEEHDIIHLDLGPNNICFKDNKITIIDFGHTIIDKNPTTETYHKFYNDFVNEGSYVSQKSSRLKTILRFI